MRSEVPSKGSALRSFGILDRDITPNPKISPEGGVYLLGMEEESPAPQAPGGDAAFARYVSLLADADPSRRWKAAEGLARLGDTRALGPLVSALQDTDWRVRMKAAWALGVLGDPRAVIPLRRAMANPVENDRVKEIIGEAVREIGMKGMG
jgi:hypothetical protein